MTSPISFEMRTKEGGGGPKLQKCCGRHIRMVPQPNPQPPTQPILSVDGQSVGHRDFADGDGLFKDCGGPLILLQKIVNIQ